MYKNMNMALQALNEVKDEIIQSNSLMKGVLPSVREAVQTFIPVPREALFMGMAFDGLPVMLNLNDPIPGSILIVGDERCGKTSMLKSIAQGIRVMHDPKDVQFGVVTYRPEQWEKESRNDNCVGIFPAFHNSSEDFFLSMASWVHGNKTSKQAVILLLDGLENLEKMDWDARQNLRWLLLRGASRRVWTIATVGTGWLQGTFSWISSFRTKIIGKIDNVEDQRFLGVESAQTDKFGDRIFTMREGQNWCRFWIPEV